MINNCAGGVTPWGTWLTCEENINYYFSGKLADEPPEASELQALSASPATPMHWGRFTIRASTSERSPTSRTASAGSSRSIPSTQAPCRGSAPRWAASSTRARPASSSRTAATSSTRATTSASTTSTLRHRRRGRPADRQANRDLLDRGTLSVARFDADGRGTWLPLVLRAGPADAANGFCEPGRRADRGAARRRRARRHQDGPARRTSRPTRRPARST